jgi:putative FmdB family regulatory protein
MPLYEYQCEACSQRFERIQKFSDPPVETCPSCGGKVRKLLSSPAIQFKGSGWYITDYARQDKKGGGDKPSSDKSDRKTETASGSDASSSSSSSSEKSASTPAPTQTTKSE